MTELHFATPPPERDPMLIEVLVEVLPGASAAGAAAFLETVRAHPEMALYAASPGGADEPLVLYVLRKVGVTTDLVLVAASSMADPALGLEAAAVRDAGARVGKRPLTVETAESGLEWYKGLGFKLVGKRKRPDGSWSVRLGWHARRPAGAAAPTSSGQTLQGQAPPDPAPFRGGWS